MSGAVSRLPLEASGLAPRMSRWSVRSTSGTATVAPLPNMSAEAICLGYWSTVLALIEVARLQRLEQDAAVEQAAEVVGAGVADVGGDRLVAVLGLDGGQPAIDLGERLVP